MKYFLLLLVFVLVGCAVDTSVENNGEQSSQEVVNLFEEQVEQSSDTLPLQIVGIGGSIDAFRERYGKEKSTSAEEPSIILNADFGTISASFVNGVSIVITEETKNLDLSKEEALIQVEQFLPPDSQVVTSLHKGVFADGRLEGNDSYTFIQTYFSESLAEVSSGEEMENWPAGSIAVLLHHKPFDPERIAFWKISTDQTDKSLFKKGL